MHQSSIPIGRGRELRENKNCFKENGRHAYQCLLGDPKLTGPDATHWPKGPIRAQLIYKILALDLDC